MQKNLMKNSKKTFIQIMRMIISIIVLNMRYCLFMRKFQN